MNKQEEILYVVIDTRNDEIVWYGTQKDCKWWVSNTNPYNRKFYKIFETKEK